MYQCIVQKQAGKPKNLHIKDLLKIKVNNYRLLVNHALWARIHVVKSINRLKKTEHFLFLSQLDKLLQN